MIFWDSSRICPPTPGAEPVTTPVRELVQTGEAPRLGRKADPQAQFGLTPEVRGTPFEPPAHASGHVFGPRPLGGDD